MKCQKKFLASLIVPEIVISAVKVVINADTNLDAREAIAQFILGCFILHLHNFDCHNLKGILTNLIKSRH